MTSVEEPLRALPKGSARRWRRIALWVIGSSLGVTTLIGLAHLPVARPLLVLLLGAQGCPVLNEVSAKDGEAYRVAQLKQRRGSQAAKATPALAFQLGITRREDADAWLTAHSITCSSEREDTVLRCADLALADEIAGAIVRDLYLQFDAAKRLVALDAQYRGRSSEAALAHVAARTRELENSVGPVTSRVGTPTTQYLDAQRLARVEVTFRCSDYVAEVSALNYGKEGIVVREQYQWLPPT
jgi:hypothetical protein